jgi:hypothetical protein
MLRDTDSDMLRSVKKVRYVLLNNNGIGLVLDSTNRLID